MCFVEFAVLWVGRFLVGLLYLCFWVWWALLWFMLKLVFAFDLVICLCYVVNSVGLAASFVGDLLVIACW